MKGEATMKKSRLIATAIFLIYSASSSANLVPVGTGDTNTAAPGTEIEDIPDTLCVYPGHKPGFNQFCNRVDGVVRVWALPFD